MQTKQLLCGHGELEDACDICLKTQLRECEEQLEKAEELLASVLLYRNKHPHIDVFFRSGLFTELENYFKEKEIKDA